MEPLRLLLIDDDAVDRLAVRRALARASFPVDIVEAGDVAEGRAALAQGSFDCVLLDFQLPGQNGSELLNTMRAEGIDTPVIMLTGHGDEQLAVEIMKSGAADYMAKGALTANRLAQSVAQAVRMHQVVVAAREADQAHSRQLRALAEAAIELNALLSVEAISARIVARARSIVGAEVAVVRMLERGEGTPAAQGSELEDVEPLIARLTGAVRLTRSELDASGEWAALLMRARLPRPARSWLAAPLADASGRSIGLLHIGDKSAGAFTDNDEIIIVQLAQMASVAIENARLFEAARAAARARDDMMAVVSHDLRNPLNTIAMSASVLLRTSLDTKQHETVQRVKRSAERMKQLLEDLLFATRIEAGTLVVDPRPAEVSSVVDETVDLLPARRAEGRAAGLGARARGRADGEGRQASRGASALQFAGQRAEVHAAARCHRSARGARGRARPLRRDRHRRGYRAREPAALVRPLLAG